jgi:hypothetical protein
MFSFFELSFSVSLNRVLFNSLVKVVFVFGNLNLFVEWKIPIILYLLEKKELERFFSELMKTIIFDILECYQVQKEVEFQIILSIFNTLTSFIIISQFFRVLQRVRF